MSDIILGGAYSVRDLMIGRPRVKVISSIINGGLYLLKHHSSSAISGDV